MRSLARAWRRRRKPPHRSTHQFRTSSAWPDPNKTACLASLEHQLAGRRPSPPHRSTHQFHTSWAWPDPNQTACLASLLTKTWQACTSSAAALPPAPAWPGAARRARFCAAHAGAARSPARNSVPRARFSSSCPPSKSRPSTDQYASIRACAGLWLPIYFARKGSAAQSDAAHRPGCAGKSAKQTQRL